MTSASSRTFDAKLPAASSRRNDLIVGFLAAVALVGTAFWISQHLHRAAIAPSPAAQPKLPPIVMPGPDQAVEISAYEGVKTKTTVFPPTLPDVPAVPRPDVPTQPVQYSPTTRSLGPVTTIPKDIDAGLGSTQVFDPSQLDSPPKPTYRPQPTYPYEMRKLGVTGEVWVRFLVDPRGAVSEVSVVKSTHRDFEAPATAAVGRWRFTPGRRSGQPVWTRMEIPIVFSIDND